MNMHITETKLIQDTLITTWEPDEKDTGFLYNLFFYENKLMKSEFKNDKIKLIQTTYYNDYQEFDHIFLPTTVICIKESKDLFSTDILEYNSFEINHDLPGQIIDFQIPSDTKVTKREW